ncbi:YdcH family protein [Paraburkholderia sp. BCC1885]|uniref:YdcH family protein n=1 Tax=Paraburkholderia sp. BCC1885 TaxID=2562669 RepID=UPI001183CF6E|nr:YdcH family protein [Paraburkholderia sp. BCC1885]
MFPEYRDLISRLKTNDAHFARLFERHNELDHQIRNMETGVTPADHLAIETLKRQKLLLKDQLYAVLKKADAAV